MGLLVGIALGLTVDHDSLVGLLVGITLGLTVDHDSLDGKLASLLYSLGKHSIRCGSPIGLLYRFLCFNGPSAVAFQSQCQSVQCVLQSLCPISVKNGSLATC